MALHVDIQDVQQWLEQTKLLVESVDPELEATAYSVVASTLGPRYDTAAWVDEDTTPQLVQSIISMWVAGLMYQRQYSEDASEGSSYGQWLLDYARKLLAGLASGTTVLDPGAPRDESSYPIFWPNDTSTLLADTDPTDPEASPMEFTMGRIF